MVGVWLIIVLASSSTPYGKVPRLILKETSRLTQAVVVSEGIFCAMRYCVKFHLQSMKVHLHFNGNIQQNLLCAAFCHLRIFTSRPGSGLRFLSRCKFSTPTSTLLYSSIIRLYPQNPVFKIVHDKSVKVYLPMYNGNVQQNPLCIEPCVTKKFSKSPLFSSTIFDTDANSGALRSTPLYSSRLYKQKTLCTIFSRDANSVLLLAHFCTAVLLGSIRKTLCLKLFMMRA